MPVPDLCLASGDAASAGSGGYGPGGGPGGAPTSNAAGGAVAASGLPLIALVTGQKKTLTIGLRERLDGNDPADLTPYVGGLKLVAKESADAENKYLNLTATIVPPATDGIVTVSFLPTDLTYAGIWRAAIQGYDIDDNLIGEYPAWLEVRKGLNSTLQQNTPISISEIRLVLRDTVPAFNTLLLDLEFSDTEIAFAIMRCVDHWNATPPFVMSYTAATFPWREPWRLGTVGYLLRGAAFQQARNNLSYSAGGVSINDSDMAPVYGKQADQMIEEFNEFCLSKKYEINASYFYGTVNSRGFGSRYYGSNYPFSG